MNLRLRLIALSFLQFFIWGSWLISLGGYLIVTLDFSGTQVGSIYATMGVAALFMPGVVGVLADRFVNAERLYAVCHLLGAGLLVAAAQVRAFEQLYPLILLNAMVFMPTIALANSVSYRLLEREGHDVVRTFPAIRVWGTIGFIVAMWAVDIAGVTKSPAQLLIGASAAALLGVYALTLPSLPPQGAKRSETGNSYWRDARALFQQRRMGGFFIFAMLLGAALQITNAFGGAFLDDFKLSYPDSFGVRHPNLLLSISQLSETVFILTIPFFLRRFGIRVVMLMSIFAWALRFGLFAVGDPGPGLWLLVLSMVVYGMAFDFFNISGSLFVDREAAASVRSSAQGLFMVMTNGAGAFVGGTLSGLVVDRFTIDGVRQWPAIWGSFAAYALLLAFAFPFVFPAERRD